MSPQYQKTLGNVPYFSQPPDSTLCSAACAQMVLGQIGVPLSNQTALMAEIVTAGGNNGSFAGPPDGLQITLDRHRPPSFTNHFEIIGDGQNTYKSDFGETKSNWAESDTSKAIVWAIHKYGVAPIALVYKGNHWIVVNGFQLSGISATTFTTANDTYTIEAFEILNPYPSAPGENESGGIGHVTYQRWQEIYLKKVKFPGTWRNKFLAICDPGVPPDGKSSDLPIAKPTKKSSSTLPSEKQRSQNNRLIAPKNTITAAFAGLATYGLRERDPWKKALAGTTPGTPILVHEIDEMDSFYYIVPWEDKLKRVSLLVSVDAQLGVYQEAVVFPRKTTGKVLRGTPGELKKNLIGKRFNLGGRQGELLVRNEALSLSPALVWKPCRESLSPFSPFYQFTVGARNLYQRFDGKVFTSLNDTQGRM